MRWVALAGAITCAAAQFPDYPVREPENYAHAAKRSGIIVAVERLGAKEQRIYLGVDLTKRGYLPLFVVLWNHSEASWLVRKDAIGYGVSNGVPEVKSRAGEGAVITDLALHTAAAAALAPVGGMNPIPILSSMGLDRISRAADVRQNLLRRELQSKTLSPSARTSGFIYVPVQNQPVRVQITLTRAGSSEVEIFELDVK